jgi:hypothetical protein
MEIIIVLVAIGLVAAAWAVDRNNKKKAAEQEKQWPFGEKLSEGKIHVKSSDVAPGKSEADRVETPAPVVTNSTPADNVPVAEAKPAKKAPAKKTAAKPAAAKKPAVKKSPAKKKST